MEVQVINLQTDLPIQEERVRKLVCALLKQENQACDEVAIHFVDKKTISELHAEYFDDPTPTDCISFPLDDYDEPGYKHLGDVFVCAAVAKEYAQENLLDPYEEISLYIVHGLLHLIGYDDVEEEDELKMRAAEKKQMAYLKKMNLLLTA